MLDTRNRAGGVRYVMDDGSPMNPVLIFAALHQRESTAL